MPAPPILQQEALFEQIRQHLTTLDNRYDFARRLAKENGWPLNFAYEVIHEYAKFLILSKEAGHPVVPPSYIDKAWHLHLLHTEAYWSDLCPNILQKPLHHEPALRAKTDAPQLAELSAQTLGSYRRFFGEPLPIWITSKPQSNHALHLQIGFLLIGLVLGSAMTCLFFRFYVVAFLCGGIGSIALAILCLAKAEFDRPHTIPYLGQRPDKSKAICSGNTGDVTSSGGGSCSGGGY